MGAMADKLFVDTNILVYANNSLSPFCTAARQKLIDATADFDSVWVSRQVFREFAAIVSREMNSTIGRVNFDKLAASIHQMEHDFSVAENSGAVTKFWLALLKETNTSGKQVHDAQIVATMLHYRIDHLLTHNEADFKRFSHLIKIVSLV